MIKTKESKWGYFLAGFVFCSKCKKFEAFSLYERQSKEKHKYWCQKEYCLTNHEKPSLVVKVKKTCRSVSWTSDQLLGRIICFPNVLGQKKWPYHIISFGFDPDIICYKSKSCGSVKIIKSWGGEAYIDLEQYVKVIPTIW